MNELTPEINKDTLNGKYLTFFISKETYGIEIKYVTEIVGIQEIIEMPEMPAYLKGIINLRGKIVPVMDVRLRFGMDEQVYNDRTCIIVIRYHNGLYGLIVDSVSEVMLIQEENIAETPNINTDNNGFVKNIGNTLISIILLLDCEKLLTQGISSN